MGLTGAESLAEITGNKDLLNRLNILRDNATVICGTAEDEQRAKVNKSYVPRIGMIAPPMDYVTTGGTTVHSDEVDLLIKAFSKGKFHPSCLASGLYNLAATTLLSGTIPNIMANIPAGTKKMNVRIGHPEGVVVIAVTMNSDGSIESVGMERTARLIMRGEVFVPQSKETVCR